MDNNEIQKTIGILNDAMSKTDEKDVLISIADRIIALTNQQCHKEPESLWTMEDACSYLKVTKRAMSKHCSEKRIPYTKIGGQIRFVPSEIKKWVLQSQVSVHKIYKRAC